MATVFEKVFQPKKSPKTENFPTKRFYKTTKIAKQDRLIKRYFLTSDKYVPSEQGHDQDRLALGWQKNIRHSLVLRKKF